ncbi:MAG: hypothetical protein KBA26_13475 [Candidatus Delongbacteria bacterium]|nr:hypothetical protein [Candidatus Delongbacteria bacterium]
MAKSEWIKSIDDLLKWGDTMMSEDDIEPGELINLFGEFDDWAAESAEDERRIEVEMKPAAQKLVELIKALGPYDYQDCKRSLESYVKDRILAENRPVRWYWKIFER